MMKKPFYLLRMIALLFFGGTVMANVNDPNDYTFLQELTSLQGSTTGWQNISYSGSQVGTTEFLMVSFSHGNPSCSQMNHIYKHKVQGGGWIKAVTAGNDDKSMEIWIREVTGANRTNQGQIDTGGAGAVHAGITVYDGLAQVTNTADVTQCNTTTIAINNNGSGPFLVVAASDNGTPESNKAMFHFSPGDDRVFIYLTTDQNFSDNTTGSLRGAIASLSLQDVGTSGTNIASFVSQSVPTSMNAGETATVSVTMQNTGTSTWTKSAQHKLGSQNPQDNTDWGMNRVFLDDADNIAPNDQKVFTFDITAPAVAGTYNFQWKMVQEGVEWFGNQSANVAISVNSSGSYLDDCDA
ncbi:MAG: NBR1-Ig-like domain-containing protein, partial [Marinoscillum sp.]